MVCRWLYVVVWGIEGAAAGRAGRTEGEAPRPSGARRRRRWQRPERWGRPAGILRSRRRLGMRRSAVALVEAIYRLGGKQIQNILSVVTVAFEDGLAPIGRMYRTFAGKLAATRARYPLASHEATVKGGNWHSFNIYGFDNRGGCYPVIKPPTAPLVGSGMACDQTPPSRSDLRRPRPVPPRAPRPQQPRQPRG